MFCPTCGQQQVSEETRFCSRCGFPLTGVTNLIANGGAPLPSFAPLSAKLDTPRKKGLKKGLMFFLLTFLIVPIVAIITIALNAEPFGVAISAILFFVGGLLRMVYALLFESNQPSEATLEQSVMNAAQNYLGKNQTAGALPPSQSIPASNYVPPAVGNWRDTNDLSQPSSVTEKTTQFLDRK